MSTKPFDATLKELIEGAAAAWPVLMGPWPSFTAAYGAVIPTAPDAVRLRKSKIRRRIMIRKRRKSRIKIKSRSACGRIESYSYSCSCSYSSSKSYSSSYSFSWVRGRGPRAWLLQPVPGGVTSMEESSTYQYIVAKGALREAKRFLLLQGQKRFGQPDAESLAVIEAIPDVERLEQLGQRLLDVSSWQELLATPPT
jgi:hypothetical protein